MQNTRGGEEIFEYLLVLRIMLMSVRGTRLRLGDTCCPLEVYNLVGVEPRTDEMGPQGQQNLRAKHAPRPKAAIIPGEKG